MVRVCHDAVKHASKSNDGDCQDGVKISKHYATYATQVEKNSLQTQIHLGSIFEPYQSH